MLISKLVPFPVMVVCCLRPVYFSWCLGLGPGNERRRYFVTWSLIGWAQTRRWGSNGARIAPSGRLPVIRMLTGKGRQHIITPPGGPSISSRTDYHMITSGRLQDLVLIIFQSWWNRTRDILNFEFGSKCSENNVLTLDTFELNISACLFVGCSVFSQWEMMLQCNVVSHWLGAFTKRSLDVASYADRFVSCKKNVNWLVNGLINYEADSLNSNIHSINSELIM